MTYKSLFATAIIAALGACSYGNSSDTDPAVTREEAPAVTPEEALVPLESFEEGAPGTVAAVRENTLGLDVSFDSEREIIIVDGREYTAFNDDSPTDRSGPLLAVRANPVAGDEGRLFDLATHGQTSSGSGTVFQVGSTLDTLEDQEGFENVFVELTREGETRLPTTGIAEYRGFYLGSKYVAGRGTFFNQSPRIAGDVSLTATFDGAGGISGSITNREGGRPEGDPAGAEEWGDMSLEFTNIDGTGFTGTVTGGGRNGANTSNGVYSGIFTGANGEEVIGGLTIQQDAGITEIGTFIAEQP